jgi:hypothetical protein
MKRVVSLQLPFWPVDRLCRAEPAAVPAHKPFALVAAGGHGLTITAVNPIAAREGIYPGLSLADARAAVPALISRRAETEQDRIALLKLARWVGRYGPRRHIDGADGLWIDISGVAHLFGGEAALIDDLIGRFAPLRRDRPGRPCRYAWRRSCARPLWAGAWSYNRDCASRDNARRALSPSHRGIAS